MLGWPDLCEGFFLDDGLWRHHTFDGRRGLGLGLGLGRRWRSSRCRRTRRRSCLLRGSRGSRLLRLNRTDQAIALRLAAYSIGLSLLHGRGVALHADPELNAEIESLFIGEA